MSAEQEVELAARERASALARGDARRLSVLLHESFRWTTHTGQTYTRAEYVSRNTDGTTVWRSQELGEVDVVVVDDTAVLRSEVSDVVVIADREPETFLMPMTQVWVRQESGWRCLGGHAGPRRR